MPILFNINIKALLFFLFFVSGFCGLLYQIIWLRIAFISFGVISPIVSVVISVFMLGLALGSWAGGKWVYYIKKKTNFSAIILYGFAEIVIGLGGFIVPNLFSFGETLLFPLGEINSSEYLFLSALILGLSILPFCFAMGVTYPFMMTFVRELKLKQNTSFSYLYLANGVGAVFGTIITAVYLIEKFGFSSTLMFGALCNFSLAIICFVKGFYVKTNLKIQDQDNIYFSKLLDKEEWLLNKKFRTYLILFITGLTSLAMEVTWIRGFTPVIGTTIYAFAGVLAVYLFSMILGSHLYRKHLKRKKTISSLKLIGASFIFAFFPIFLSDPHTSPKTINLLLSILPLCVSLGYLTPKLIDQFSKGDPNEAGRAYAVNIVGGILGPLLAGYFLIPNFGIKSTLILLTIPYGILFLYSSSKKISKIYKWGVTSVGTFATIISIFFVTTLEFPMDMGKKFVVLRDSTATVAAFGEGMNKELLVNGIGIARLTPIVKMMAHLPLSIRKQKQESALIIALGMGTTLRSAASWGVNVKCVELVPSVVDVFPYYFEDANLIMNQKNVEVIVDDGRRFLNRTKEKYDVIIIDPPPPIEAASTSLLYSREFYKIVTEHLKENGIFQQWFYYGEKKIFEAMLRSLVDVFPHVKIYKSFSGGGFHFLASQEKFDTPNSKELISHLGLKVKEDILEWVPGVEFLNDSEREAIIKDYFDRSFKKEIPKAILLNKKDDSIFISDDQPYNEYYLIRRYMDKKKGLLEFIE